MQTIMMHGKDWKTSETHNGKRNNARKDHYKFGPPVLPGVFPGFYALYLISGFSDMADGIIARKTNTVSEFAAVQEGHFIRTGNCQLTEKEKYRGH